MNWIIVVVVSLLIVVPAIVEIKYRLKSRRWQWIRFTLTLTGLIIWWIALFLMHPVLISSGG